MFSAATKTAAQAGGYKISRSLRFNAPDNANLDRGFTSSPTNSKIMTFSAWIKRCRPGDYDGVFSANNGVDQIRFQNSDGLHIELNNAAATVTTTQVFRDPSSWYHIVVAFDTTQATASNRVKVYVNGTQVTSFATANYPPQNYDLQLNGSTNQRIGIANNTVLPMAGYMTEIYRIDGQALTPSSFGETNAQTGVWQPKAYSGSYGTNGFYLNFSDNSNTTAATLGKDYSGNGNNWTPNNFSVAAGAGNDSLVDTPTPYGVDTGAGGNVRGNYATLNPLARGIGGSGITLSNGNLDGVTPSDAILSVLGTIGVSSGKWYWEITPTADGSVSMVGIGSPTANLNTYPGGGGGQSWGYYGSGEKYFNNVNSAYGSAYGNLDVIGVALDMDAGTVAFYKNGVSQGTAFTGLTGTILPMMGDGGTVAAVAWNSNFGQRPFAYTAPSGFKALCTQNLPTPTIGATTATQAGQYFNPVLYTGDGTNNRTISAGMTPDFVWLKSRSNAYSHALFDSVRGAGNYLASSSTGQENFAGSLGWTNSGPTSGGFKVDQGSNGSINESSATFVAWLWKANGSGSTNTAGSITSTVSANTTSGFSIVTYTGNGANATIGHGLGVAPRMVIQKYRTAATNWFVYHASLGADKYLLLNTIDSAYTNTGTWQNTAPTASVFSVGAGINDNGNQMVAYCFAEVPGYSRFGSFVGNGSSDGPFVFCGFRPRWIMYKDASGNNVWVIVDTASQAYNIMGPYLLPNATDAEGTVGIFDVLSNGFKVRIAGPNSINTSGNTIVFAAFAESPFKFALAR